jgi:hypothetical protein
VKLKPEGEYEESRIGNHKAQDSHILRAPNAIHGIIENDVETINGSEVTINIRDPLGQGAFGVIHRGKLKLRDPVANHWG